MNLQSVTVSSEDDVVRVLGHMRRFLNAANLSEMDTQKVLVSASELVRNILDHAAGHGVFSFEWIEQPYAGIRIEAIDDGPGIERLEDALNGKWRSPASIGLGVGLSGVQRLMDEVQIESSAGGTKVIAIKWQRRDR